MNDRTALEPLLAAAAAGDRAAFRALYEAFAPKLFGVVLRICRDRPMAEDAVQETFVEIWRKASAFDPARGSAGAWMATIARNRAIDLVRRRGRAPGWDAGDPDEAFALLADPRQRADGGAEAMTLAACLGRLAETPRRMLLLAYVEGLSREELSARFDAPVNTVKTWLRRGLIALRACLDG